MRSIAAITFIFFHILIVAQSELTSLYFTLDKLEDARIEREIKLGEYSYYSGEKEEFKHLIITRDSIYVRIGTPMIAPKTDFENKGYIFKDGYIYGMDTKNGVAYKEFNDTIVALYYQYDTYASLPARDAVFYKNNDEMVIFLKNANGLYSLEFLEIKPKKILISSIDHDEQMDNIYGFRTIRTQYLEGFKTYIISPTAEEIIEFIRKGGFNDERTYKLDKFYE